VARAESRNAPVAFQHFARCISRGRFSVRQFEGQLLEPRIPSALSPRIVERNAAMAQKVQVVLVDDLDGGPADETVTFSLDGVSYEIDLTHDNAAALRDALAPYVGHGRRIGSATRRTTSRAPRSRNSGPGNPAEIREWAKGQGIAVNERGRISADLKAKYDAAHA
jgi:hypothetical protein